MSGLATDAATHPRHTKGPPVHGHCQALTPADRMPSQERGMHAECKVHREFGHP